LDHNLAFERKEAKYQPLQAKLAQNIDDAMKILDTNKAFVRLSTRSAKDAVLANESLIQRYVSDRLVKANLSDLNEISIVIWNGLTHANQVTSGKEAAALLVDSARISTDCERELKRGKNYQMKVIIRQWVDINIGDEFRCFVTNKKINCLCQYFDNCYFQNTVNNKDKILDAILKKWELIKDRLPFENGIVDFAFDISGNIYLIECNPLDQFTGGGLFDYVADWEVITGRKPLEFRTVDKNDPRFLNQLEATESSFSREIRKAKTLQEAEKAELPPEKTEETCLLC